MVTYLEISSPRAIAAIRDCLVLALRSTGPDPETDRIFQLGMLRVEGGEIINRAQTLVKPDVPLPPQLGERFGITEAALDRGLDYGRMAASLADLLLGGVVVADEEALGFVRVMLESEGFEGEFSFIDVRNLAAFLQPELDSYEPENLAEHFGLDIAEEQGILRDAALRFELLRACQALIPAPEGAAAPAKEARKAPPRRKTRPRSRKQAEQPQEMSVEDLIGIGGAVLSFLAGLISFRSPVCLLFLLAALVFAPIPFLRRLLSRCRLDGWKLLVLGVALFLLASLIRPSTSSARKARSGDGPAVPAFIILNWDQEGDYGEPFTVENENGVEETYIAFHLPVGIYRVLNNNPASARVTVCDDEPKEEEETDITDPDAILNEASRSVTVLASKSKEITVDEGQHVRLSENAENVIFQYLGEIPEVLPEEEEEAEDPNATAIVAWVNGKEVRMRKSASVSAFIMATFDTGQEVIVTGETGDWTAVTVNNQKGYIYSRYITYTKPAGSN